MLRKQRQSYRGMGEYLDYCVCLYVCLKVEWKFVQEGFSLQKGLGIKEVFEVKLVLEDF